MLLYTSSWHFKINDLFFFLFFLTVASFEFLSRSDVTPSDSYIVPDYFAPRIVKTANLL